MTASGTGTGSREGRNPSLETGGQNYCTPDLEPVCPRFPPGEIRAAHPEGDKAPLRCKQWDCPECGPWLRERLMDQIRHAVRNHSGLYRLGTLTLPPEAREWDEERQKAYLMDAWRAFRERLRRARGGMPGYLWVVEPHKDGTLHLHFLADAYIPQSWLSDTWEDLTGAPVVDIRAVDGQGSHAVASYLGKYLAKNPGPVPGQRYGYGGGVSLKGVYPSGESEWFLEVRVTKPRTGESRWVAAQGNSARLAIAAASNRLDRPPP